MLKLAEEKAIATAKEAKPKTLSRRRAALYFMLILLGAIVAGLLVRTYVMDAQKIESFSMNPTYFENDFLLNSKLQRDPSAGDVIVFKDDQRWMGKRTLKISGDIVREDTSGNNLIKRVVAVGGDTVEGQHGKFYVNGEELKSPAHGHVEDFDVLTVPEDSYFVAGDNLDRSKDSRQHIYEDIQFVHRDSIEGTPLVKLYSGHSNSFVFEWLQ